MATRTGLAALACGAAGVLVVLGDGDGAGPVVGAAWVGAGYVALAGGLLIATAVASRAARDTIAPAAD